MCANLNVYLITKANNDKPVLNFEFSFSVNFFFVLTWRKLFWKKKKKVKAKSNDPNYCINLILLLIIFMFQVRTPLFWKLNDSAMLCDLCYVYKKIHSSSFCPGVRYYFCFWICFILNLSFVILLFGVYLCNKFINEMRMGRTICTNSNIVIKYKYNFMSPSDTGFCFML